VSDRTASRPATGQSVSAIIVNWNGADDLAVELPTLAMQTYAPHEVIVVDNGSTDASAAVVRNHGAKWLPLARNLGVAAALNRGADIATGDFLLFLNQDMAFPATFLENLVAALVDDDLNFAVDAVQKDWSENEYVHLCSELRRTWRLRNADLPGWKFSQYRSDRVTPCLYASAANTLVRATMFRQIGGFDSNYFAAWEDVDLAFRARARGWNVIHAPDATCRHQVSITMTTEEGRKARLYGTLNGRMRFAVKFAPWPTATLTIGATVAGFAKDIAIRRADVFKARWTALCDLIRELPSALTWRWSETRSFRDRMTREWRPGPPVLSSSARSGSLQQNDA